MSASFQRISKICFLLTLAFAFCFAAQAQKTQPAPAKSDVTGHYEGLAKNAAGEDIHVAFDLTEKDGAITGMINSDQGNFPITGGSHKADAVTLEFDAQGTAGTIQLQQADDKLTGNWTAGDDGGPVDVKKAAPQAQPPKEK
ncbi:MAG TPA: hypothetical protein VGS78_06845 [Candidatus Sulfotelmatobacter sp.]|nr:hypothetical protein [Candidatus Sulfotelmatobacter sp.]